MLKGVLAPGGTASEVSIPGYELAGKTGTASKVDPATGEYSETAYVASFIGFAPASDPKLLCAVVVDEPQYGSIYGGTVAAPAFGQIMSFALPYLRIIAAGEHRSPASRLGLSHELTSCATGRWTGQGDRGGVEISGLAYDSRAVAAGDAVLLRPGFRQRRARFRRAGGGARRGGARRRAAARPGRARGRGCLGARRDGPGRGPLLRRSERGAAGRRGDRHERQDHDGVPRAGPARGRPATADAGCWAPSSRSSAATSARSAHDARGDRPAGGLPRDARRRRSAPVRWRSPRTRWSSGVPTAIRFAAAIFTNLTQDHLDFHATMEDYFQAKRRLFTPARRRERGQRRRSATGRGSPRRSTARSRSRWSGTRESARMGVGAVGADYRATRSALRRRRVPLHAAHARG